MTATQDLSHRAGHAPYIPFALPSIGEEEIAEVVDCLRSGWLTTGPRAKRFEAEFAEYIGCRHAVAVNSCTAALHLALEAVGVQPGDEVLVPTMTFAATAEVVRYLGATPVLLDCDPETLNLDPDALARFLTMHCDLTEDGARNRVTGARVRAVMPVHYAGLPCAMDRLGSLTDRYGLHVVEDAAHALPAHIDGRPVGTFGTAGAFSFYANKTITTGEGGMLTTDDEAIAARARMMSLHGMSRDAWLRFTAQGSWSYQVLEPGFKYNLSDMAAALGIVQLRHCEELWRIRDRYAARYTQAFTGLAEVQPPAGPLPAVRHAWHLYVLRLNLDRLAIDRARFIEELAERGIGASVHYMPLHMHPYYRNTYGYRAHDLPVAAREYARLVTLPLYPRMSEQEIERVIDAVLEIVERYRA